jgi:hypothetical protein
MKTVIIHASEDDSHAKAVAESLQGLGVNVFIALRERCFADWQISCKDDEVVIATNDQRWTTSDVLSVLWRRDYIVEPAWVKHDGITPQIATFLAEQRSIHVESAFKRLDCSCPFINTIDANRRCNSKMLQQHVARQCGLTIPKTYIGSNQAEARNFTTDLWNANKRCCTKNIESTLVELDGIKHARLTKLFTEQNLPDLDGLAVCPMIFQEYVEKQFEYRITVVGEDVFPCRIDSQMAGGKTAVDWRNYNIPTTPHYATKLDAVMKRNLVQLVRTLHLTYGAIDMIEDKHGDFFFLEINSMGQWLWIEDLTELPITASIAKHLAEPG